MISNFSEQFLRFSEEGEAGGGERTGRGGGGGRLREGSNTLKVLIMQAKQGAVCAHWCAALL